MLHVQSKPDIGDVCTVWNRVWTSRPKDVEQELYDAANLYSEHQATHWGATLDGQLAAVAIRSRDIGAFHPQKWTIEIAVLPEARNRGIAAKLYKHFLQETGPLGILKLTTLVQEGDDVALRFALTRGFVESKRDFLSCLNLGAFEPSEWPAESSSLRISRFEDLRSPQFEEDVHALFEAVRVDIPRSEPPTPVSLEFYREHVLGFPAFRWDLSVVALDGTEVVGFSTVFDEIAPHIGYQGLTAVKASHRGQGIAIAMKLRLISLAKASGKTEIHTDNDTRNVAMLAINERLGFQRQAATITMVKDIQPGPD